MKSLYLILIISFFVIINNIYADNETIENIEKTKLSEFFNNEVYGIIPEKFLVNERQLSVAIHYINEKKQVFDRVVVYERIDNSIEYHLIVKDQVFYTGNMVIILDISEYKDIKGFSLKFSYPKDSRFLASIVFIAYFSDDMWESEQIKIEWNPKNQSFQLFDMSNYEL